MNTLYMRFIMLRAEVLDRRVVVVALHLKMIVGHHHFVKVLQSTTQGSVGFPRSPIATAA